MTFLLSFIIEKLRKICNDVKERIGRITRILLGKTPVKNRQGQNFHGIRCSDIWFIKKRDSKEDRNMIQHYYTIMPTNDKGLKYIDRFGSERLRYETFNEALQHYDEFKRI